MNNQIKGMLGSGYMNDRLDSMLKNACNTALTNIKQRELKENEKKKEKNEELIKRINTFINKARRNKNFTNLEIFRHFTYEFITNDRTSKNPDDYDMVWIPTSCHDIHAGVDRYLPIFAKEHNMIPYGKRIVFFDYTNSCGYKENTVGEYDANKYVSLGFDVKDDGKMGIDYDNFEKVLKKAADNKIKGFSNEVIDLLKKTYDELEKINSFMDKCNRYTDLVYLSACQRMITRYKQNPNVSDDLDYEIEIPYISEEDYMRKCSKNLSQEELEALSLLPEEYTICYVIYNKKRVPIYYEKLESMFKTIRCDNSWCNRKIYMYINSIELEELLKGTEEEKSNGK